MSNWYDKREMNQFERNCSRIFNAEKALKIYFQELLPERLRQNSQVFLVTRGEFADESVRSDRFMNQVKKLLERV